MHLRAASIEELLSLCTPKTQRLIDAARKQIVRAVPHATEKLRGGWGLIGYNAPAYFAFIAPGHDSICIGFEWGVMLTDVGGVLEGTGSQVRYFAIGRSQDLKSPLLTLLLQDAAAIVPPARKSSARS